MKKDLILLTQKFPFEYGEEFLENELHYLAKGFGLIYLIPTGVRDFSKPRDVPDNVVVIQVRNPRKPIEIFMGLIKSLPEFPPLFLRELNSSKLNPYTLKYLSYHIPFALQIKKQIKEIIQTGQGYSFYSYWMDTNAYALALLKKEDPKCGFIIRSHGGDLYNDRHPHGQILFRKFVYDQVSLIAPVSKNGSSYIRMHWPEYGHKVRTFYLGVHQQPMGPIGEEEFFRIISCSSLIPLKRVNKILKVLSLLQIRFEWIHFGGTAVEVKRLENLAESRISPPDKLVAKGQIDHKDLIAYYRTTPCDLFINLSESEGIPVSIMEAISFGIPVISNNVGGVKEIVTEQTGILVEVNDPEDHIAHLIQEFLLSGKPRSPEFKKNVYAFWDQYFNAQKNYEVFCEEIKKADQKSQNG